MERGRLFTAIRGIKGLEAFSSDANFVLIKSDRPGDDLWRALLDKGILVRNFGAASGLENCLRVTVGSPEENDALIEALENLAAG